MARLFPLRTAPCVPGGAGKPARGQNMDVLDVREIRKSFNPDMSLKRMEVLHGVSFHASHGEIMGFLGPNGAGKTTTIKIILGLLRPDSGTVTIFGRPAGDRSVLANLGYLPENPFFYPHLNLEEFLGYCGELSGLSGNRLRERRREVIAAVGLEKSRKQRLKGFSKGMLQRAGLAQSIIHDPDFIVLDEPFSGLDPIGRKTVRDILLDLRNRGKTIFFSSHILPDMEALCDRACIIREGVIVRSMGLDEIFQLGEGRVEVAARNCPPDVADSIGEYIERLESKGAESFILVKRQDYVRTVVQHLYNSGAEVLKVVNEHPSLEDVFVSEISGASASEAAGGADALHRTERSREKV